ncbi:uncharacterized protein LOC109726619 [Ananas comosus]|uniref:Uncharacterized protein LOC109726619 n=1 Tax=Ananas comosus TaxID=4615 RepID=A0A6P5H1G4_ANACO|nr:uncharacterized protein LOC109726619 [Ananas comosus]
MAKRRKRSRGGGAKRTPNPKRKPSPEITKRDRKPPVSIYTPPGPREKQRPLTPLDIEQGPGTKLKEIPNVSKKLSKAKVDENMQFLHQLLYGRKKVLFRTILFLRQ